MNAPAFDPKNARALGALLRALSRKPGSVAVELRPIACPHSTPNGWLAAVVLGAIGGAPPRVAYGSERFASRAECERHAIRVANGAARAFASVYGDGYHFTVTTQGTRA
jgi:hypothetical protein